MPTSPWKTTPAAPPEGSLREIMEREARDRGDEDLQAALRLSTLETYVPPLEDTTAGPDCSEDEALARALAASFASEFGSDADLALALTMREAEEARERSREVARRAAARRFEHVRVVSHIDEAAEVVEGDEPEVDVGSVGDVLRREGVVVDDSLQGGLIGRRSDGGLVSKHDLALDARLKAQTLQDTFACAGDIASEKVPAPVYNHLVRKAAGSGTSQQGASPHKLSKGGRL